MPITLLFIQRNTYEQTEISLHINSIFRSIELPKNLRPLYSGLGHTLPKEKTMSFVHAMCVSIHTVTVSLDTTCIYAWALKSKHEFIRAHCSNLEDTHKIWAAVGGDENILLLGRKKASIAMCVQQTFWSMWVKKSSWNTTFVSLKSSFTTGKSLHKV